MIAMALVNNPDLLIADEPTTALDVTVQAQIIELIDRVKTEYDIGVILITHDLGVIAEVAHRGHGHVRRPCDGSWARPTRSSRSRFIHTRGACSSRSRMPTSSRGASCRSRVRHRRSSSFRRVARSIPRCPHRFAPCDQERPEFRDRGGGHLEACHLTIEDKRRLWAEREVVAGAGGGVSQAATPAPASPVRRTLARASRRGRAPDEAVSDPDAGLLQRTVGHVHAVEDVSLHDLSRRDARPGRRVRLREVDDSTTRPEAPRTDGRRGPLRRARTSRSSRGARCGRCGARCRWSSRIRTRR